MEENKKFFIENKKVWVAGSTGMVGKSIIKLLKRRKCQLIFSNRKDLDLTDQRKVKNWMSKNKPDVIFLAAAKVGGILANKSFPVNFLEENLFINLNIIKNAFEASENNTKINIKTSYSRGRRLSGGGAAQLHVPIQVEVVDKGPGIAPDIRDNIFDPFVSGKAGGSGLGLALVASVVADHGGMVEVDSVPGRTVFRLNFPLSGKGHRDG